MHASFLLFERDAADTCLRGTGGHRTSTTPDGGIHVRFLRHNDLPALIALEHAVWKPNQAAGEADMRDRIARHPQLAIGAFCTRTGRALASLFAKPAHPEAIRRAGNWNECVNGALPSGGKPTSALFGISLSSIDAEAAKAIFGFFWPYALKNGWNEMYLGSPVPGLRDWARANPGRPVEEYIFARHNGLPRDPQLRYYCQKGFRQIVAVRPNYFPHEASLDHGVVLGGRIPLSFLSPLWRRMPMNTLLAMKKWLFILR